MVESQLRRRGILDPRVLEAMREVPRHRFVAIADEPRAYEDHPIAIGHGQTISQPYMVAEMVEALELRGSETVLEVGAGSGYQAAILGRLARRVYAIESDPDLAHRARQRLDDMYPSGAVHVIVGDGSLGYPAAAPYEAIVVAAAAPEVPPALLDQLAEGGRLVVPVGDLNDQELRQIRKVRGESVVRVLGRCSFVPLIGARGWQLRQ
jgi:protein-L-isoaspartate(D-aspartate) O-methyltransferase